MWLATALLVGIMSPESVLDGEKPSSEVFREWFDAAVDDDLKIPVAIARKARSFRYVFIGGFRNERMSGYFAQNAATLRRWASLIDRFMCSTRVRACRSRKMPLRSGRVCWRSRRRVRNGW